MLTTDEKEVYSLSSIYEWGAHYVYLVDNSGVYSVQPPQSVRQEPLLKELPEAPPLQSNPNVPLASGPGQTSPEQVPQQPPQIQMPQKQSPPSTELSEEEKREIGKALGAMFEGMKKEDLRKVRQGTMTPEEYRQKWSGESKSE